MRLLGLSLAVWGLHYQLSLDASMSCRISSGYYLARCLYSGLNEAAPQIYLSVGLQGLQLRPRPGSSDTHCVSAHLLGRYCSLFCLSYAREACQCKSGSWFHNLFGLFEECLSCLFQVLGPPVVRVWLGHPQQRRLGFGEPRHAEGWGRGRLQPQCGTPGCSGIWGPLWRSSSLGTLMVSWDPQTWSSPPPEPTLHQDHLMGR